MKLCECGCGKPAPIIKEPNARKGWVRGEQFRFCSGHGSRVRPKKPAVSGRYNHVSVGFDHPRASVKGTIYQHVAIAGKALGRPLMPPAEVHHVDGNGHNNANKNLVICQDRRYHLLLHVRQRIIAAGGNPNIEKICSMCKRVKSFVAFGLKAQCGIGRRANCKDCQKYSTRFRRLTQKNKQQSVGVA